MTHRPIGPTAHGLIDYGFLTMNLLAPTLLNLKGPARSLCYGFAATQGLLNALTDTPVGLAPVVPLRLHGESETTFVPSILLLPWLTGAMKQPRARLYFDAFFALAAANYMLTDFNADEPTAPRPSGQRLLDALGAELDQD